MNAPSAKASLTSWLGWLEHLHPSEIDMGLERVGRVADRAQLRPASMPVILVGGTNGKGSTVALLTEIYKHAGYKVGAYTSPHIEIFNERMRIDGRMLDDATIVDALHTIEAFREPETLTYFEYTTLAAMYAFNKAQCDVVLLEVGLGGRLDATNLWDCDCAILTSIALDHQAYLGNTRAAVALEKVAIGRKDKPLIVGEPDPPDVLARTAREAAMDLRFIDFGNLPESALPGVHQQRNAACALAAVDALQDTLPVQRPSMDAGLEKVTLAGRFEQLEHDGCKVILDVAHNPAAAEVVCDALQDIYPGYDVHAVFAVLADKDIAGVVSALAPAVTHWYCTALPVPRATPAATLLDITRANARSDANVELCENIGRAWKRASGEVASAGVAATGDAALADAAGTDVTPPSVTSRRPALVLVAGSFFTLSELREYWQS